MSNTAYLRAPMTEQEKYHLFEAELMPLADALMNFSVYLTQSRNSADDLVQETYIKAWRSMDSYIKGTNAKAWLFTIAKNTYINMYRQAQRRGRTIDVDDVTKTQDTQNQLLGNSDLRDEVFRDSLTDEVEEALRSLDAKFSRVLWLAFVEDFSYEEISDILKLNIGTVRSRLHRGRKYLADRLRGYGHDHGYNTKSEPIEAEDAEADEHEDTRKDAQKGSRKGDAKRD